MSDEIKGVMPVMTEQQHREQQAEREMQKAFDELHDAISDDMALALKDAVVGFAMRLREQRTDEDEHRTPEQLVEEAWDRLTFHFN